MIWIIMYIYQIIIMITDFIYMCMKCIYLGLVSVYRIFYPELRSFVGEIILITGSGHGIGRELALQFSRVGAEVVCVDLNEEWNTSTVSEIRKEGGVAWSYTCDVSDRQQVKKVCKKIVTEVGVVGVLINNAGIMPCAPFAECTAEQVEKLFKVNVFSHFWMIQEWLPLFKIRGSGHIVGMSSLCGVTGTPFLAPYCSSKFAVTGLMEALNEELRYADQNPDIHMTRIHPYTVDTGLAVNPRIRFPSITPVLSAEECGAVILSGLSRGDDVIFVPTYYYYLTKILKALPRKMEHYIYDFMDTGVDPN